MHARKRARKLANCMRATAARRVPAHYRVQRAYVAAVFEVLERLIVAASAVDPVVREELAAFPEGCTIGFSILGDTLALRLRVHGGQLVPVRGPSGFSDGLSGRPDLEVVFKHVSHAFLLLSLQESSATAYARDRMVTHGDVALTMRFMRCADRVQGVMLPSPLAARALKALPPLPTATRLGLAARIAGGVAKRLVLRSPA
jgi:hypothetical protein